MESTDGHMRMGLFGGTFNPVHLGHLQVIGEVKEIFHLDRIYIIPAAQPPHKHVSEVVAAADRLNMVRLAFGNLPGYVVSDVEILRSGPSYTIDTFRHFRSVLPDSAMLALVLGLDAFLEIDTWKYFRELLRLVPMIVMSRPQCPIGELSAQEAVERYLRDRISPDYRHDPEGGCYVHPVHQRIYSATVSPVDISATVVREAVKNRRNIRGLVPDRVADYIEKKGLYT
ncbi:MAG: nicotinate-nucleotide adenylyltransferase [Thermodesulfobacteriota bacterium]